MNELLDRLDEERLREWFVEQRWFGSKAREVAHLNVLEVAPLDGEPEPMMALALVEARFHAGTHELYQLPLGFRHCSLSRSSRRASIPARTSSTSCHWGCARRTRAGPTT